MTLQSIGGLGAETEVTEERLPTLQGSHPAPRPARRPPPGGRWGTRPPLSLVSPFLGNSLSSPLRSTETLRGEGAVGTEVQALALALGRALTHARGSP